MATTKNTDVKINKFPTSLLDTARNGSCDGLSIATTSQTHVSTMIPSINSSLLGDFKLPVFPSGPRSPVADERDIDVKAETPLSLTPDSTTSSIKISPKLQSPPVSAPRVFEGSRGRVGARITRPATPFRHGKTEGQKKVKRAQGKALKAAQVVQNLAGQEMKIEGELDALDEVAEDALSDVAEEIAQLNPGADEDIKEDYVLNHYPNDLETVVAHSNVERGIWGKLYSIDGLDEKFGEGVSWVRRWWMVSQLPDLQVPVRGVDVQAFTLKTIHADLYKYHRHIDKRYATNLFTVLDSFPNYKNCGDGQQKPTFPYVDTTGESDADFTVSMRVLANMKHNKTARDIVSMSEVSLSSLYCMRAAACNIPIDRKDIMDGTVKLLYDMCLEMLEVASEDEGNPLNFPVGTTISTGPTPLLTATVAGRVGLKLCHYSEVMSTALVVVLYSVLASLGCLLVYTYLVPSYLALTLMTILHLLLACKSGLAQFALVLIIVSYVVLGTLFAGMFDAILSLCLWIPTYLLARGLAKLLIRFGVVNNFSQRGSALAESCKTDISDVIASLNWSLITAPENILKRPVRSIPDRTPSNAIAGPSSQRLRRSSIETHSSLNISQWQIAGPTWRTDFVLAAAYYIQQITQALRLTSLRKSCESVSSNCIVICLVIFLVIMSYYTTCWWRSPPPTLSVLQTLRYALRDAACQATCAPRWAMGSQTSCSCSTVHTNLMLQSQGWLKVMMDYLPVLDQ